MRVALYSRISARDGEQDIENQQHQLRRFCQTQGWQIIREYEDHDSGSRSDRTQFRQMLQDTSKREWDILVFWALDRFTREGTLATLKYLEQLESYGVRWRSLTESWIDSAGPFRDVIISLLSTLARQERVRIQERVNAGLDRARRKGTSTGRSIGRPRVILDRDRVVALRRDGHSWPQIASQLGTSVGTVRRAYQTRKDSSGACQNPSGEKS